jgi:hypothetical protein
MREYHVGVDVTVGTWVYVDAENEKEAKTKAKESAEIRVNTSQPILHTEVHCINVTQEHNIKKGGK